MTAALTVLVVAIVLRWVARRLFDYADRTVADHVDRAEREYIARGPACRCGCPRPNHQGTGWFDGTCTTCTTCTGGYWPGDGTPYSELFPPPDVYRRRAR